MSPRERAARRLCRFNPTCAKVCEECAADVDAVLDEIREPSRALLATVCSDTPHGPFDTSVRADWQSLIDSIKRGEG